LLIAAGALYASRPGAGVQLAAIIGGVCTSLFSAIGAYLFTWMGLDRKGMKQFATFVFMGMFVKMVFGLLAVVAVLMLWPDAKREFVVAFGLSYFIFTVLELFGLLKRIRPSFLS